MHALILAVLATPASADADTDPGTDTTDTTDSPTGGDSAADDGKDGCGCALGSPTSLVSLTIGGVLLAGIRRKRTT
jgi:hypothetical protein